MPKLISMICDMPKIARHPGGECVQVDVMACGVLVERVGMSPHMALLIAKDLQRVALAMIDGQGGAEVVQLREAEG